MGVAQKEEASIETWRLTHGSGQILDPAHQMPIINVEGRKQGTAYFAVPGRFSRALLKLMRRDMPFRCNCACTFHQGTVPPPPPLTVLTYFCFLLLLILRLLLWLVEQLPRDNALFLPELFFLYGCAL